MTAARGWYHAEGDPPGTVRLWNGQDWVGFPQRDPNIAIGAEKVIHGPAYGQQRLKPWGVLAMIGLVGPALAYLFQSFVLVRILMVMDQYEGQTLESVFTAEPDQQIVDVVVLQLIAFVGVAGLSLLAGILFVPWFFVAYLNLSKWTRTRYEVFWAIVAWFVPFMNLRRPSHIMQELCESSPRPDREGEINPVAAWGWWIAWLTATSGVQILQWWAFNSADFATVQMILIIASGLCLLAATSAVLGIRLVWQISWHQDLRFKRVAVQGTTTSLATV